MTIDISAAATSCPAYRANGATAKADNLKALADLSATADNRQQADHIRGIVATTLAHLAADATAATRDSAAQWQKWALGLSDQLLLDLPAPVVTP
jgi:dihydroxyacetone kinase